MLAAAANSLLPHLRNPQARALLGWATARFLHLLLDWVDKHRGGALLIPCQGPTRNPRNRPQTARKRPEQTSFLSALIASLDAAPDPRVFVCRLLHGATAFTLVRGPGRCVFRRLAPWGPGVGAG
jgi:hypothetical protein